MNLHRRSPPGKYRLTVDDFRRLDETGVFGTDRTELIDGDIIIMNAEYRPHGWIVDELKFRLRQALNAIGSDLYPMSASIALSGHDMPLPDVVLTREPRGPGAIPVSSVAIVVEVSSTTLSRDMRDKLPRYAEAGVPEYWIVDVDARTIRRCWMPNGHRYSSDDEISFGDQLPSATIEGLVIATNDF